MNMEKRYRIIAVVLIVLLSLYVQPVLGGNSVTISGKIIGTPGPYADFSASPLTGRLPLRVLFADQSTGTIASYAWDFQNDGIVDSREKNPRYIYTRAGTYSVGLTVTGPGGSDREVKTDYITVSEPVRRPVARFTQDKRVGRAPLTVQFMERSLYNPTNYLWSFGDGSTSTLKNPVHTYTRQGVYHVQLRVWNDAGSSQRSGSVIVVRYSNR